MRPAFLPTFVAAMGLLWLTAGASAQELLAPPTRSEIRAFPFRQASATEELPLAAAGNSLKLAPRRAEKKAHAPSRKAAATPTSTISTVVSSLAIVLGLLLAIVWCSRRFAPAGAAPLPKEAVELLGRAPLAGRQTMQLIRVGNRLLLVALSAGDAKTLTEITDPIEVEHLAGLCRRGRTDSASASFGRVLSQLASEPVEQSPRSRPRGAA
jgi:flagellar protein FliO/FliZ